MRTTTTISSLLLAGLLGTSAHAAAQPSFDCSKATSETEKLICSDEDLAALDRKMAAVFDTAVENYPQEEVATLRAEQRGWIKGRDECWKADDLRQCVEYAYRSRLVELQIRSGQLVAPTPTGYTCKGNEGTSVFAAFYRDTDPPSAVVTVNDDQVIAFLTPAASGSKYVADNVELWIKGDEAMLDWYGTSYQCNAR